MRAMRLRSLWLLLLCANAACSTGNESPIKPQPPSPAARLAAQACACTTLECVRPLEAQLERMSVAQHGNGNTAADHAEAKAKISQCAARLSGK